MAMKEHPFVVTTTFQGDGETIKYDVTKPGRSDAVGKAFKLNADGKGELVEEGEAFDGKVLEVDDDHKFTGAYMFGGLLLPIGEGATVARGDKLVGALGPDSAKGYVKGATAITRPADDANAGAVRTAVQTIADNENGKGQVLKVDSTHALASFPG